MDSAEQRWSQGLLQRRRAVPEPGGPGLFGPPLTLEDRIGQVLDEVRELKEELRGARERSLARRRAPEGSQLLSVEQVASKCHAQPKTVRAWIASGRLQAKKAGHRYVVTLEDLETFLQATAQPKPPAKVSDQLAAIMRTLGPKR